MPEEQKSKHLFKMSELVIMCSGALFLVSVFMIWLLGSFVLWFATVLLYVVGVILFLMNR